MGTKWGEYEQAPVSVFQSVAGRERSQAGRDNERALAPPAFFSLGVSPEPDNGVEDPPFLPITTTSSPSLLSLTTSPLTMSPKPSPMRSNLANVVLCRTKILLTSPWPPLSSKPLCYFCDSPSHIVRDCPEMKSASSLAKQKSSGSSSSHSGGQGKRGSW